MVKVNIKGEPWKSRDEEPWYHFRTVITGRGLPDDYRSELNRKMVEQDKLIFKLYNQSFGTNFTPEEYYKLAIQQEDQKEGHLPDFVYAMHELIDIFNRPDIRLSFKERLDRGMFMPKVSLTYLPGPSFMESALKEVLKEYSETLKTEDKILSGD